MTDQPQEQTDYGTEHGHPPIANKVVCVDFDGTIIPWGPLMADARPFPGVREQMQALRDADYRIVIFSSRLSESWLLSAFGRKAFHLEEQTAHIKRILDRDGIPYDYMTADKIPAEVYFDDKAVRITEQFPLDRAIAAWLRHASE